MKRFRPFLFALILTSSLLPMAALGQRRPDEAPAVGEQPGTSTSSRTFTLHHKSVDDVYLLISPYLGPGGSIRSRPHQRTLEVTDTPETLRRIAAMIEAFDVPPRSVEVLVQLILASVGGEAETPPPPPIRGVIRKLSALNTRWKDYRLLGDARITGTEGENSSLRVGDDYRVAFRVAEISKEDRRIRFKPFVLQRREPSVEGTERFSPVMSTVLNLRDSQLFIVGASKMEHDNRALFMTVMASAR